MAVYLNDQDQDVAMEPLYKKQKVVSPPLLAPPVVSYDESEEEDDELLGALIYPRDLSGDFKENESNVTDPQKKHSTTPRVSMDVTDPQTNVIAPLVNMTMVFYDDSDDELFDEPLDSTFEIAPEEEENEENDELPFTQIQTQPTYDDEEE